MTEINYYRLSESGLLKEDWNRLETGPEMSYFQTYDWYSSLLSAIPRDTRNHEARLVVLKENGTARLIAPIWVVKRNYHKVNEAGIFMLGRSGWSDYLNFIYSYAKADDIVAIINDISVHYGLCSFYFEDIPESTLLYRTITDRFKVQYSQRTTCLKVQLTTSTDCYRQKLSKHTLQNLRTANNRLTKDCVKATYNFDDTAIDKELCCRLRIDRLSQKKEQLGFILSVKLKFFNLFRIRFKYGIPFYADGNSHIMSVYLNGELAAYFNYGIDNLHNAVIIMAAGMSEKYAWYSPGLLLAYNFILDQIQGQSIRTVDFTRGNEPYKYSLGCMEHFNYTLKFTI